MSTSLKTDLRLLRTAVGKVKEAAREESRVMNAAMEVRPTSAMSDLHEAHVNELDAVQMLVTVMELVEKRYPEYFVRATPVG